MSDSSKNPQEFNRVVISYDPDNEINDIPLARELIQREGKIWSEVDNEDGTVTVHTNPFSDPELIKELETAEFTLNYE